MVFKWWRLPESAFLLGFAVLPFWSVGAAAQAVSIASPEQPVAEGRAEARPEVARTRFVIGLAKATRFQVFSLSSPNRVIVELPEVGLQLPSQPEGGPTGLVKSFRGGQSAPGQSRIVIDVTVPVVVESAKLESSTDGKTHRLALEIVPVEPDAPVKKEFKQRPFALGATGLTAPIVQPPMPQPAVRPALRAAKAAKPIIVLDPGHGGDDSGAEKAGTVEKDVVLAFGKRLKGKLEASGLYKVLMTRDTDVFVPLGERLAFAERNGAHLFIAIHADYADSNTQARGATIYSLKESVANSLKRSAKGDAGKMLSTAQVSVVQKASGDVNTVKGFLSDLAEREVDATRDRTSLFSRSVVAHLGTSTNLRDDPDKEASFRVLKTARFPSVLIELAYVTNKEDAELLKSDAWRDKVAESILTAVDNYFSHQVARMPL